MAVVYCPGCGLVHVARMIRYCPIIKTDQQQELTVQCCPTSKKVPVGKNVRTLFMAFTTLKKMIPLAISSGLFPKRGFKKKRSRHRSRKRGKSNRNSNRTEKQVLHHVTLETLPQSACLSKDCRGCRRRCCPPPRFSWRSLCTWRCRPSSGDTRTPSRSVGNPEVTVEISKGETGERAIVFFVNFRLLRSQPE